MVIWLTVWKVERSEKGWMTNARLTQMAYESEKMTVLHLASTVIGIAPDCEYEVVLQIINFNPGWLLLN